MNEWIELVIRQSIFRFYFSMAKRIMAVQITIMALVTPCSFPSLRLRAALKNPTVIKIKIILSP